MGDRQLEMHQQLQELFPEKNLQNNDSDSCLISDSRAFMCVDDNETQQTFFLNDDEIDQKAQYFELTNPKEKEINMLLLDGRFFNSGDGKRCDCIVFDDKYWCYAELKLRVKTDGKNKHKKTKWEGAEAQLESSIAFFKNEFAAKGKNFLGYKQEAFIVMKKKAYPTESAEFKTKKVKFLLRNKMPLISSNKKRFN